MTVTTLLSTATTFSTYIDGSTIAWIQLQKVVKDIFNYIYHVLMPRIFSQCMGTVSVRTTIFIHWKFFVTFINIYDQMNFLYYLLFNFPKFQIDISFLPFPKVLEWYFHCKKLIWEKKNWLLGHVVHLGHGFERKRKKERKIAEKLILPNLKTVEMIFHKIFKLGLKNTQLFSG